ncbi:MAG: hypothetical protein H6972_06450, partial [Gammaproteobacteria bacterium]|nr:hypothetical protein [Gammaproteobacteria bacterium]
MLFVVVTIVRLPGRRVRWLTRHRRWLTRHRRWSLSAPLSTPAPHRPLGEEFVHDLFLVGVEDP